MILFALCLVCFQLWFGFEVVCQVLRKNFDLWNKVAISIPVGFLLPAVIFFIMSTVFGANIFHVLAHLVGIGILAWYLSVRRRKSSPPTTTRPSTAQLVALSLAVPISLILVPRFYFSKPRTLHSVRFTEWSITPFFTIFSHTDNCQ